MLLPTSDLETAEIYQARLEKLTFKACGFKHDFVKKDGTYDFFCESRESENLGCAHIQDRAIRSTIKFLAKLQIITLPEQHKLIHALSMVNLDLAALDIWTQELDSLLRALPKLDPQLYKGKLEQQGLNQARFISSPELLKLAPKEEQEIVVLPKIYLKEKLSIILKQIRTGKSIDAKVTAQALVLKMDHWLAQDDNAPLNFDWTLN